MNGLRHPVAPPLPSAARAAADVQLYRDTLATALSAAHRKTRLRLLARADTLRRLAEAQGTPREALNRLTLGILRQGLPATPRQRA